MGLVGGTEHQWPLQGMLARNGVTAALAAAAGARGSRRIIEGPGGLFVTFFEAAPAGLDLALDGLGRDYELMRASLKRYPGSGFNVIPQQLMLDLVTREALRPDDVVALTITVPEERRQRETVMEHEVTSGSRAIGSVRFLLAAILAQGAIDPRAARYDDPTIQRLVARTRITFEHGRPLRYARIDVDTAGGARLTAEADDHAFPPVDRLERLRQYGTRVLPDAQLERLGAAIASLEQLDDTRELVSCLAAPRS
jgi:2-methylcitrate dehydratase PrpD